MLKLRMFLMGLLVGGGGLYCADRYHIVQTRDGLIVVRRAVPVYLRSTYSDVRNWTETKWSQYPELTSALLQAGYHNVLSGVRSEAAFSPRTLPADATGFSRSSAESPFPWWRRLGDESPSLPTPEPPPATTPPTPTSSPPPTIGAARSEPLVEEDSLLERLTRQLREGAAIASPAERTAGLRERPLTRQPISPPAGSPQAPVQNNVVTPPPPDRAALPTRALPADQSPSIRAAALEQMPAPQEAVRGETLPEGTIAAVAAPDEPKHRPDDPPAASGSTPALAPPQEGVGGIRSGEKIVSRDLGASHPVPLPLSGGEASAGSLSGEELSESAAEAWRPLGENWTRPVLRESVQPTVPSGGSANGNRLPVEVDAGRLRERIPPSVQEGWRSIAPSSSASGRAIPTGG